MVMTFSTCSLLVTLFAAAVELPAEAPARPPQVTSSAPAAEGAGTQRDEPVSEGERRARARSHRWNGVLLLGFGTAAGAHATWAWSDLDGYLKAGLGDDPGPSLDFTPLVTPAVAPFLAGLGGARIIEAAAYERGLPVEVPWTHWLGWVPASVAIGFEVVALDRGETASKAQGRVVAVASAASTLCFLGSTLVHTLRLPDGPSTGRPSERSSGPRTMVVPLLAHGAEGGTVGAVIAGAF